MTTLTSGPTRSPFVTAVAWVFIVLAGFSTFISLLQNVMIALVFPVAELAAAARHAKADERMPWFASFMFQNFRLYFLGILLLSAGTLAIAIGLLQRKNWARILFVALMVWGIFWSLGGVVFSILFVSWMPQPLPTAPQGFGDQFALVMKVMVGFNVLIAVAFSALFAWIAKRLLSAEIRREFSAT